MARTSVRLHCGYICAGAQPAVSFEDAHLLILWITRVRVPSVVVTELLKVRLNTVCDGTSMRKDTAPKALDRPAPVMK